MKILPCCLVQILCVVFPCLSQADLVWTGPTSGNVNIFSSDYNSGGGSIASGVEITDNVIYDGINVTAIDNNAFNEFLLGDGFALTIKDSTFVTSASGGFNGPSTGGATFNVVNSTLDLQYLSSGWDVQVDGTSSVNLRGAGDPVNSQTNGMTMTFAQGAQLTLASFAEFAEQGNDLFAANSSGQIVSYNSDNSIFSFSGATATAQFAAVPEPGSIALLAGFGFIAYLRRKR